MGQTHVNTTFCAVSHKHIEKAFAPVFNPPFMQHNLLLHAQLLGEKKILKYSCESIHMWAQFCL